ncbi:MAG TPA: hypothetical protein DEF51_34240 [Myxococcales bacterium]|nr:hypothetical protein [Myxococcales bacterium]
MVMHEGRRGQQHAEPSPPQAHAQLVVLEHAEPVALVEPAERLEGLAPHRRAQQAELLHLARRALSAPRVGEQALEVAIAGGIRRRVPAVVGGRADQPRPRELERGEELRQPAGRDDDVVVQDHQRVGAGELRASIDRAREATSSRQPRPRATERGGRRVVDHDHLVRHAGVGRDRGQALREGRRAPARDHDRRARWPLRGVGAERGRAGVERDRGGRLAGHPHRRDGATHEPLERRGQRTPRLARLAGPMADLRLQARQRAHPGPVAQAKITKAGDIARIHRRHATPTHRIRARILLVTGLMSSAPPSAWLHRTPRGTFVGDEDGQPARLGGATRLVDQLWRFRDTLYVFAASKFRAAHRAQMLGLIWPIAYPTVLMIVMSVVFGVVFKTDIEGYPVLLMLGLVPWHFLSHAWTSGMHALLVHAEIVKRTAVPPWVIITGTVLSDLYNLGFSSLSILPLIAVYPESFHVSLALLWLPAIVVALVAFGLGLGLSSGVLNVIFRDTGYIVDSILIALFWATPIIYPMSRVPGIGHTLMHLNPMATIVEAVRVIVIEGTSPPDNILIALFGGSFGVLLFGVVVYRLFAPVVSDHV